MFDHSLWHTAFTFVTAAAALVHVLTGIAFLLRTERGRDRFIVSSIVIGLGVVLVGASLGSELSMDWLPQMRVWHVPFLYVLPWFLPVLARFSFPEISEQHRWQSKNVAIPTSDAIGTGRSIAVAVPVVVFVYFLPAYLIDIPGGLFPPVSDGPAQLLSWQSYVLGIRVIALAGVLYILVRWTLFAIRARLLVLVGEKELPRTVRLASALILLSVVLVALTLVGAVSAALAIDGSSASGGQTVLLGGDTDTVGWYAIVLSALTIVLTLLLLLEQQSAPLTTPSKQPVERQRRFGPPAAWLTRIAAEEAAEKAAELRRLLAEERLYRDPELSVDDLADPLSLTRHQLSELLNVYIGTDFRTLVNRHRAIEVAERLSEGNEETLSALAYGAGFRSHSTFVRAFKRQFGVSPRDYDPGTNSEIT